MTKTLTKHTIQKAHARLEDLDPDDVESDEMRVACVVNRGILQDHIDLIQSERQQIQRRHVIRENGEPKETEDGGLKIDADAATEELTDAMQETLDVQLQTVPLAAVQESVEADDEGALGALHDWHWMVD